MDFEGSEEDRGFRAELQAFLAESLPADWEEIARDGPGSDAQAAFARIFCPRLAEQGYDAALERTLDDAGFLDTALAAGPHAHRCAAAEARWLRS